MISNYLSKESKVITKFQFSDGMSIEKAATISLTNLNISLLDTVLILNPDSLKNGSIILEKLVALKNQKFTKNIGISIYSLEYIQFQQILVKSFIMY